MNKMSELLIKEFFKKRENTDIKDRINKAKNKEPTNQSSHLDIIFPLEYRNEISVYVDNTVPIDLSPIWDSVGVLDGFQNADPKDFDRMMSTWIKEIIRNLKKVHRNTDRTDTDTDSNDVRIENETEKVTSDKLLTIVQNAYLKKQGEHENLEELIAYVIYADQSKKSFPLIEEIDFTNEIVTQITFFYVGTSSDVFVSHFDDNKTTMTTVQTCLHDLKLSETPPLKTFVKGLEKAGYDMPKPPVQGAGNLHLPEGEDDGYRPDLVELHGLEPDSNLMLHKHALKSQAIVVAGESGSGKTTFSRKGVKRRLRLRSNEHVGVIYMSLSPERIEEIEKKFSPSKPVDDKVADRLLRFLIGQCLMELYYFGQSNTQNENDDSNDHVHEFLSDLHSRLNKDRNGMARQLYDESIEEFFSRKSAEKYKSWWEGRNTDIVLDGLIIVLDEAGRHESLARGLIDISRDIVAEVVQEVRDGCGIPRAKTCKVVITGTGLDQVNLDSQQLLEITDPAKAQVIVAKKVNFQSQDFKTLLDNNGIKEEEIMSGTYSSVLSENARMLIEAIIPNLTCEALRAKYVEPFPDGLQTKHRIEAASSDWFMHFATRVFVTENGLKDIVKHSELESLFLEAFRFYAMEPLKRIRRDCQQSNTIISSALNHVLRSITKRNLDPRIFNYGCCTSIVRHMSFQTVCLRASKAVWSISYDKSSLYVMVREE